jgi:hypothetical protein
MGWIQRQTWAFKQSEIDKDVRRHHFLGLFRTQVVQSLINTFPDSRFRDARKTYEALFSLPPLP